MPVDVHRIEVHEAVSQACEDDAPRARVWSGLGGATGGKEQREREESSETTEFGHGQKVGARQTVRQGRRGSLAGLRPGPHYKESVFPSLNEEAAWIKFLFAAFSTSSATSSSPVDVVGSSRRAPSRHIAAGPSTGR